MQIHLLEIIRKLFPVIAELPNSELFLVLKPHSHHKLPSYNTVTFRRIVIPAQSGQLPSGSHIPRAPHAQTAKGKYTGKSYWSLQNGEQNLPNIQSSQAIAPCFGGIFSMQSFAERRQGKMKRCNQWHL